MIPIGNLHWLSGLLEGEGCFSGCSNRPSHPSIQLAMTDRDVVEKAATILGSRVGGPYFQKKRKVNGEARLPFYRCGVSGRFAVGWMMTLYSLLGSRRRKKISGLLYLWMRDVSIKSRSPRSPNGTRTVSKCRPDKPVVSRGMCSVCYRKFRYKKEVPV